MAQWQYEKGLHDLGGGIYAYLQPNGGWGWNNAGLISDGEVSLLVDTLFDGNLTREMLTTMCDAVPSARNIGTVVNTHANGDHCYGNGLLPNAEIVASEAGAKEMMELPPEMLAQMMANAPNMGELGAWLLEAFGDFDFSSASFKAPTRTFCESLDLNVGDKAVRLIEVGPAHTKGDILVHLPQDGVVFTGDILFIGGVPLIWAGPVGNWIRACELILDMDVAAVVPGHGPITDKQGVARVRDYLVALDGETRKRFDAGMSVMDAAHDIVLDTFNDLGEQERIAVNIDTLYREYRGGEEPPPIAQLLGMMAAMAKAN